ncbi:uncharacterized protein LOC143363866 [Halictus rubicundus]
MPFLEGEEAKIDTKHRTIELTGTLHRILHFSKDSIEGREKRLKLLDENTRVAHLTDPKAIELVRKVSREFEDILALPGDALPMTKLTEHSIPVTDEAPIYVKQFQGLAGYYRRFIPNFSQLAKPMNTLLRKDRNFDTATLLSELVTEYGELTHKLRSLINNGIQGKLDPTLLNSVDLVTILKSIESKFGAERMLFPATKESAFLYQRVIEVNTFVLHDTQLCFEMKIPILEPEQYNLYQLVPIPLIRDKLMYVVSITVRYILLDSTTKYYSPVESMDIHKCKIFEKIRICERTTPVLTSSFQDQCIAQAIHIFPEI